VTRTDDQFIGVVKSGWLWWAGYVASLWKTNNLYIVLVGKSFAKR
jgi:hypothetical protein